MALVAGVVAETQPADRIHDFAVWMAGEQRRVFLLCLRMLRDPEDADTAAQDAFLKAYRALEKNSATAPEDPARWITRIAVNTCLDRLRSRRWMFWRRRAGQMEEEVALTLAPARSPSPEDRVFASEIGKRLAAAMERLSDRQRSVFVLRHYDDRSLEEIGALLGLDLGTVKAHMARATARLRNELRDLYGRHALDRG